MCDTAKANPRVNTPNTRPLVGYFMTPYDTLVLHFIGARWLWRKPILFSEGGRPSIQWVRKYIIIKLLNYSADKWKFLIILQSSRNESGTECCDIFTRYRVGTFHVEVILAASLAATITATVTATVAVTGAVVVAVFDEAIVQPLLRVLNEQLLFSNYFNNSYRSWYHLWRGYCCSH